MTQVNVQKTFAIFFDNEDAENVKRVLFLSKCDGQEEVQSPTAFSQA